MSPKNRFVEVRLPTFCIYRVRYVTASCTGHYTSEDVADAILHLQEACVGDIVPYIAKHTPSISILVDGVVTQVPVTNIKLHMELDLKGLDVTKSLKITFGGKLHNLLHEVFTSKVNMIFNNKNLAQLFGAGLITTDNHITCKGEALLGKLHEEGPKGNIEERKLCRCLLYLLKQSDRYCSWPALVEYLFSKKLTTFAPEGGVTYTEAGERLLEKHILHLMTLKTFQPYVESFINFLPADMLPSYMTDPDPKIRKAATERHKQLQEREGGQL